ncbi:protein LIAT1 isoform X2 [Eleginops maclovinus]|uniref:protein LIAT1 isoform X2 n=1 Tax=Eleginops maclovinus TaxID=56733 RepID=UPI00307FED4D
MPEDKYRKLLQPSRSCDTKKKTKRKKKKRKKATTSSTPPETPQAVSLPPETSPVSLPPPQSPSQSRAQLPKLKTTSHKDGELLTGSGRKSKKHPKDSPTLLRAGDKNSGIGELCTQARESLRWDGVLEDPQAEEQRLELYRANRRQRYITHRDALLKETTLRKTFLTDSREKKGFD